MNCRHGNQLLPTDSRDILLQSLWEVLNSFSFFYFPYITTALWSIVRSGTGLILLSMFLFLSFLGQPLQKSSCDVISLKSLRLRHFKSDQDEVWQECSLCKYALADGVRFLICHHNFKMAAMKSLHVVLPPGGWKWSICCMNVRQRPSFLIYSTVHSCLLFLIYSNWFVSDKVFLLRQWKCNTERAVLKNWTLH